MQNGRFITIEGVEGVGKTTNLSAIRDFLRNQEIPCLVTREPGGTPIAEEIRSLLLESRDESLLPEAELLLIFAARIQHVEHVIKPALARGLWVVCDRFTDSTYAYQGAGRALGSHMVRATEELVLGGFCPDLTFLLDLPVSIGLTRAKIRGTADRFERESQVFFERVRRGFLEQIERNPSRYRVIDTSLQEAVVAQNIEKELEAYILSL